MDASLLFILTILFIPAVVVSWYTIQGAPFVESRDEDIALMLKLLKAKRGDRAVDIGSGDGKLVLALAKKGIQVDGYELNPWLVYKSRKAVKKNRLEKYAHIYWKSLWKADCTQYNVVTIYAIKHVMGRLEKKLLQELPKGSRVASNYFIFPTWKPQKEEGRIHVYKKGETLLRGQDRT